MPTLRLVQPTDAVPPSMKAPKVLTPTFLERQAAINHAIRELRALRLTVVWSKLAGPLPQAHIQRDASVSLGPLLDRMGPRTYKPVDGCTVASGVFEGVLVSWIEPQPH